MKNKPFIIILFIAVLAACAPPGEGGKVIVEVGFRPSPTTKARPAPPDDRITDVNLYVFNSQGELDEHRYFRRQPPPYQLTLLGGAAYSIYACVNLGYDLGPLSLEKLMSERYHLAYPDEYSEGFPMTGSLESIIIDPEAPTLELPLERLMSKLTLSIDRTALDPDVNIIFEKVRIGGCPTSVRLFGESKVESSDDIFLSGYTLSAAQTYPLNRDIFPGISYPVSLYMLENMQSEGPFKSVCSYIELFAEYLSPEYNTRPGEYLIYRFYLGENDTNYDVERNSDYHITLSLSSTALSGDSWQIDTSALEEE